VYLYSALPENTSRMH